MLTINQVGIDCVKHTVILHQCNIAVVNYSLSRMRPQIERGQSSDVNVKVNAETTSCPTSELHPYLGSITSTRNP